MRATCWKTKNRGNLIAELARDISEVVVLEKNHLLPLANRLPRAANSRKVAFHAPCTLQHGLKLKEGTETLLVDFGLEVVPVAGAHLCCGAAGTYSLLQPELSQRLLGNKIQALTASKPSAILTANIGCQCHLQGATALPVRHWIEAIDHLLREQS